MPGSMSGLHGCFSFAFNDYLLSVTRLLDNSRQPRGFTTMQADKERKVLVCWYNANHCVRMHIWDQHLSGAVSYWQHDLTLPLNHSILLWDREWLQNGYSDKRNLKCTVSFISLYVRHKSLLVTLIGLLVTMMLPLYWLWYIQCELQWNFLNWSKQMLQIDLESYCCLEGKISAADVWQNSTGTYSAPHSYPIMTLIWVAQSHRVYKAFSQFILLLLCNVWAGSTLKY